MRLLRTNLKDGLRLDSFDDARLVKYAILSHTWDKEEVLFEHIGTMKARRQKGYKKIEGSCNRARQDGFEYIWVDTCCINKASSAELSEAINSMFLWYKNAQICYAHLQDVSGPERPDVERSQFRRCKWFTRGWTLQELIAPRKVEFFTAEWTFIGERTALAELIEQITGVDYAVLCGLPAEVCVAKRMSWAAKRQTTRVEDRAYSLMGLFGLHMPTIYGEGERAFLRLQQEIMSHSTDHSIFAWESEDESAQGLLASSPDQFANCANIIETPHAQFTKTWKLQETVPEIQRSGLGLRMELPLFELPNHKHLRIAALACKYLSSSASLSPYHTVGILLLQPEHPTDCWQRLTRHHSLSAHVSLLDVDCLVDLGALWKPEPLYAAMHMNFGAMDFGRLDGYKPHALNITIKAHTLYLLRERYGYVFARVTAKREWEHAHSTPLENHIRTTSSSGDGQDLVVAALILHHDTNYVLIIDFAGPYSRLSMHVQIGLRSRYDVNVHVEYAPKFPQSPNLSQSSTAAGATPLQGVSWVSERFNGGPKVELTLVRTGINARNVCKYVLDVKLRGSSSGNLRRGDTLKPPSAEWVPGMIGFVPTGAITLPSGTENEVKYFARVRNDRCLLPGFLREGSWEVSVNVVNEPNGLNKSQYEILVGPSSSVGWIAMQGAFNLNALAGSQAVVGGYQEDGAQLYIARTRDVLEGCPDTMRYGTVKIGQHALIMCSSRTAAARALRRSEVRPCDRYDVLVHVDGDAVNGYVGGEAVEENAAEGDAIGAGLPLNGSVSSFQFP